jgi:hypothetical protein
MRWAEKLDANGFTSRVSNPALQNARLGGLWRVPVISTATITFLRSCFSTACFSVLNAFIDAMNESIAEEWQKKLSQPLHMGATKLCVTREMAAFYMRHGNGIPNELR